MNAPQKLTAYELAARIAEHLGGTVATTENHGGCYARICLVDSTLGLYWDGRSPKAEISGHYDKHHPRDTIATYEERQEGLGDKLGFTITRPPESVANEVRRKILPKVGEVTRRIAEYVSRKAAQARARDECGRTLVADIAGAQYNDQPDQLRSDTGRRHFIVSGERGRASGYLYGAGESVSFDAFTVDPQTARQVLEILGGAFTRPE